MQFTSTKMVEIIYESVLDAKRKLRMVTPLKLFSTNETYERENYVVMTQPWNNVDQTICVNLTFLDIGIALIVGFMLLYSQVIVR